MKEERRWKNQALAKEEALSQPQQDSEECPLGLEGWALTKVNYQTKAPPSTSPVLPGSLCFLLQMWTKHWSVSLALLPESSLVCNLQLKWSVSDVQPSTEMVTNQRLLQCWLEKAEAQI